MCSAVVCLFFERLCRLRNRCGGFCWWHFDQVQGFGPGMVFFLISAARGAAPAFV